MNLMKLIPKNIKIPDKFIKALNKGKILWHKHGADICWWISAGSSIGATIDGIVSTTKLDPIIDEAKAKIDAVKEKHKDDLESKDYKKELTKTYISSGAKIAKNYRRTIALEAISIATGHHGKSMLKDDNAMLLGANMMLTQQINDYRQRVREDQGEAKDLEYQNGLKEEEVKTKDENGKKVKEKKLVKKGDSLSQWARVFDERNPNWTESIEVNLNWLKAKESEWNYRLAAWDIVHANEIYRDLGFKISKEAQEMDVGKLWDPSGPAHQLDFGLWRFYDGKYDVDGVPASYANILLDFNFDVGVMSSMEYIFGKEKAKKMLPGVE